MQLDYIDELSCICDLLLFSWKSDLQPMTKEQLEESVRSAASEFVTTADLHLGKVQLNDPSVKFQASIVFASYCLNCGLFIVTL